MVSWEARAGGMGSGIEVVYGKRQKTVSTIVYIFHIIGLGDIFHRDELVGRSRHRGGRDHSSYHTDRVLHGEFYPEKKIPNCEG